MYYACTDYQKCVCQLNHDSNLICHILSWLTVQPLTSEDKFQVNQEKQITISTVWHRHACTPARPNVKIMWAGLMPSSPIIPIKGATLSCLLSWSYLWINQRVWLGQSLCMHKALWPNVLSQAAGSTNTQSYTASRLRLWCKQHRFFRGWNPGKKTLCVSCHLMILQQSLAK